jgi:hypothetical protein
MPLAQRFSSHHSKSHGSKTQPKALNQPPNFQSIKITLNPSPSQIKSTDNPLNDATYNQIANSPFSNKNLHVNSDTVEQNSDPPYLANNFNMQFPKLIHTQNSYDDLNDQIHDCDDLQDEPHFLMRADFQTDDSSLNDSQFMENDTTHLKSKSLAHNFSQNSNQQTEFLNHSKIRKQILRKQTTFFVHMRIKK